MHWDWLGSTTGNMKNEVDVDFYRTSLSIVRRSRTS